MVDSEGGGGIIARIPAIEEKRWVYDVWYFHSEDNASRSHHQIPYPQVPLTWEE